MAYTPYYTGGWQSGEEGGTPITPAALNNMEDGIGAALTAGDIVNNLTSTSTTKPLSAAQGRALNYGKTKFIGFPDSVATWSELYSYFANLEVPNMTFTATAPTMSLMSGGKLSSGYKGIISKTSDGVYDIFAFSGYTPQYMYIWRISGLTSASATPTVGTVYRYSGTAI